MTNIVERLRSFVGTPFSSVYVDNLCNEAADTIAEAEAREARLVAALKPFATYMKQMNAYATLHRGKHLPDSKVLAYSQTEMGTSAALTIGHFRHALAALGEQP